MRTAEEILMRCKLILSQPDIISLVDRSSSPTSAYDMVMNATGNSEAAKAARWLGVLRRDCPDRYAETLSTLCHVQKNTAKKGEIHEKVIREGPA